MKSLFVIVLICWLVACGKEKIEFMPERKAPYSLEINDKSITISGSFNMYKEFLYPDSLESIMISNCNFYYYAPDTVWVLESETIQGSSIIFANVDTIYVLNYDKTVILPYPS